MIKTKLGKEKILECVTASASFEGFSSSILSEEVSRLYLSGKLTGEEAILKIKESFTKKW